MAQKFDIREIHNEILDYLLAWNSAIRNQENVNPYFYLRNTRDRRFRDGYWFPGNEDYLCISFWKGGDAHSKTPNIYLDIHRKYGCRVIFTSKDSGTKYSFLTGLIDNMKGNAQNNYIPKLKHWIKPFSEKFDDYMDFIKNFVANDKVRIDAYLQEHLSELEQEDFVQPLGFITPTEFEEMLSKVLTQKNVLEREKIALQREQKIDAILDLVPKRLPVALKRICIENYQGIVRALIENIPIDTQWIFVTGENGFGKTSFLQGIALALSGNSDLEKYLDEKTRIESVVIYKDEEDTVIRLKSGIKSGANLDYDKCLIGYGPSRLNVQAESSQNEETKSKNNVISLFDSKALLKNLAYELFASNSANDLAHNALVAIIKEVTNGRVSGIKIEKREVLFREKIGDEELPWMPLERLAAGFRNIINIVGDIFIRFSQSLGHSSYKDFFGIVLIDEIENHLHPHIQKEIAGALSSVFPKIQFIATTHSPIPLLGASKKSAFIRIDRNLEDGITAQLIELEVDISKLLPDSILSSPIFGFDEIFQKELDNVSEVNTEDSYDEAKIFEELKQKFLKIKLAN